jgi:hypothetical protein
MGNFQRTDAVTALTGGQAPYITTTNLPDWNNGGNGINDQVNGTFDIDLLLQCTTSGTISSAPFIMDRSIPHGIYTTVSVTDTFPRILILGS